MRVSHTLRPPRVDAHAMDRLPLYMGRTDGAPEKPVSWLNSACRSARSRIRQNAGELTATRILANAATKYTAIARLSWKAETAGGAARHDGVYVPRRVTGGSLATWSRFLPRRAEDRAFGAERRHGDIRLLGRHRGRERRPRR